MTDTATLEEALSRPTEAVVEMFRQLRGDVLFLGVGGKMGPSMARMARRACDLAGSSRRVIGVSRFSSSKARDDLESHGVETIGCDLLDEAAVAQLPEAPLIVYMAGMKFGATGQEPLTWAMNALLPAIICKRYPKSRIAAFSTGNVYGLSHHEAGGSRETDLPAPVGEYAMSCLGRERVFQHYSQAHGTPVCLIRLNYACDLRYGVLVDIAQKVQQGQPVPLGMSWFNTLWQGDANAYSLLALGLADSPSAILNVTGPEQLRVREVATQLGALLGTKPQFEGEEQAEALLSNVSQCLQRLGPPSMSAERLISNVADWLKSGGSLLHKPTHFESRDGKF
jgi:nucleoside-diphosphate-sugar epimerase